MLNANFSSTSAIYRGVLFYVSFLEHYLLNSIILYAYVFIYNKGPLWSWSYGSWIYNFLCNQCLSPL